MKMDTELMRKNAEKASALLSAMSNEKRLMILCYLSGGERAVGELAKLLGVRQSSASQHLALLRKDGFVRARREGQTLFYSLAAGEPRTMIETLYSLYCKPAKKPRAGAEKE